MRCVKEMREHSPTEPCIEYEGTEIWEIVASGNDPTRRLRQICVAQSRRGEEGKFGRLSRPVMTQRVASVRYVLRRV